MRQDSETTGPVLLLQTAFNLSLSRAGQARPRQWKGQRMIQRCCCYKTNLEGGEGGVNGSAEQRTRQDRIDQFTKIEHRLVLFAPPEMGGIHEKC